MSNAINYPKCCQKSIRILMNELGTDAETSYAMMLMTATLMDLHPDDAEVVHIILQDCGIEDSDIA